MGKEIKLPDIPEEQQTPVVKVLLGITEELGWVDGMAMAKRQERVPVVLTRDEIAAVLQRLSGRDWLMGHRDVKPRRFTHTCCRGEGPQYAAPFDGLLGRGPAGA